MKSPKKTQNWGIFNHSRFAQAASSGVKIKLPSKDSHSLLIFDEAEKGTCSGQTFPKVWSIHKPTVKEKSLKKRISKFSMLIFKINTSPIKKIQEVFKMLCL